MTSTTTGFTPSQRQREAIEAELGPVLVLAGPGAGKTFCLTERIRHLVEHKQLDPAHICAVTFTNKAAEEITDRLKNTLGERARSVKGGTLHALCAEILREHGEWIGVRRGFGIADEEYQRDLLQRLGVWNDKRYGTLLSHFGRHRVGNAPLTADELEIFSRYRSHLQERNLVDFDDLVVSTAELLATYDEIAESIAARWRYVLVDEFQDLNPRQYAIVRRLAREHRNLFVVGDDEQSVYSWTGADPRVLLQFANDFGVTKREIVLDENRRTARQIFESARKLLGHNPTLFDKTLRAERESPHPVRVVGFDDDRAEAGWLLSDLQADRACTGTSWGEYGVLYRRHEIGDALEAELVRAGIPCRLAAGRALQDHPVVQYLIAALRVIAEPADALRQETFARVVLPPSLWSVVRNQAERSKQTLLPTLRTLARRWGRDKDNEDARKLHRADHALQNLAALGSRHRTLSGLVEELLSQRVGEYRSVLEDRHDELSDPGQDPEIVALAARLEGALHGRRRVRLQRMGGLEIALSGLLLKCGITSVVYGDVSAGPDDVAISPRDGGRSGLAFGLFKALQLVRTGALQDSFDDFVSVDLETNTLGAEHCDIVELGAVRVRAGEVVAEFSQLVRPPAPITPDSAAIHGITNDMVVAMPALGTVWPAFRAFCGNDTLVAHNGNGFDFPILRRLGEELEGGGEFPTFDSLLLARQLHPGSRRLGDLAHAYGISHTEAHRALPDARALVPVFLRLQQEKHVRARKTSLGHLLDCLALALVLSDPATVTEEAKQVFRYARSFALGRYSDCLEQYQLGRAAPDAFDSPPLDEVIRKLGGQRRLEQIRQGKSAQQRYPAAMGRLRRLLDEAPGDSLAEQLRGFLDRVALSRSDASEQDPDFAHRVNLLTLHSTKGLEFSRVYIVGAEDAQLPGVPRDGREVPLEELQEARRLLYVGMTRAKDRLVLTRSERRRNLPTGGHQFLTEMGLTPRPPG